MKTFNLTLKYNPFSSFTYKKYLDLQLARLESMIFLATTGRSATLSLEKIFNAIPDCRAEHEPYPSMHDHVLHEMSFKNEAYSRETYNFVKSVNLRRSAVGCKHYLEANHMFIKTYIDYVIADFGRKVKVIHLVRDPVKVANSIFALQDYPGTVEGNRWWLDHTSPSNLVMLSDLLESDKEFSHPFYKGLWYWYEIETRVAHYRKKYPETPFFDFRTEDLNHRDKVFGLLNALNISYQPDRVSSVVATRSHSRKHQKKSKPMDLSDAVGMHQRFRELLSSKGFETDFGQ